MLGSSSAPAWIAFTAAMIGLVINGYMTVKMKIRDSEEVRKHEILEERKRALFDALRVIDHVYANSALDVGPNRQPVPPANPHSWDVQEARDAMNRMIIYCADPDRTVRSFVKAIGLYNPSFEKPSRFKIADLEEFRREVARELDLPTPNFQDEKIVWIYSLIGTGSGSIAQAPATSGATATTTADKA